MKPKMNTPDVAQLNDKFSLQHGDNYVRFQTGRGGLPVVEIQNNHANAVICLQGAHLLSWIPRGEREVIWLSEAAKFEPGKAIRGGIPVCWPWFGAHGTSAENARPDYPAHGFVRTANWEVICTEDLDGNSTRISFTTEPQSNNAHMWPAEMTLQLQVTVGKKLEMELITHNNDSAPVTISQALHTYFRVGDVSDVLVHGLEDTDYLDKLEGFKRKQQIGPVSINEEVDRIYLDTVNDCVIKDRSLKRNLIIIKCGSNSTVVWNPWRETASKMGDLGEDGYKTMLCVESCNAATDAVTIDPGKAHHLWVQYQVQTVS